MIEGIGAAAMAGGVFVSHRRMRRQEQWPQLVVGVEDWAWQHVLTEGCRYWLENGWRQNTASPTCAVAHKSLLHSSEAYTAGCEHIACAAASMHPAIASCNNIAAKIKSVPRLTCKEL
jgi:hypothetical protein